MEKIPDGNSAFIPALFGEGYRAGNGGDERASIGRHFLSSDVGHLPRSSDVVTPMKLTAVAAVLFSVMAATTGPPTPNYAFVHGQWWNGSGYEERTVYTVDGVIRWKRPIYIDQTFDLHGGFVIPPLAEGHNHWLEPSKVDDYNACYLADGVYYVRDMANLPFLVDQFRDKVNLPTSVDWVSAMTGFTGPGAHPSDVIEQMVGLGVLPKDWKPDYDKQAEFVVRSEKDLDERFPLLLEQHPAYVKAFLVFSDRYEENLKDPNTKAYARGMDPTLLPHLVKLAHAAGLKLIVHIYSAADFRNAVAARVDEIAHFPGNGYGLIKSPELFRITAEDAKAAAKAHIAVTTTLSWLGKFKEKHSPSYEITRDQILIPNMKLLKQAGVRILIGSDEFRRDVVPELQSLRLLRMFSDAELLRMDTESTAQATFPHRNIGKLQDGYEANFLVLDRDPAANLDNLSSISMRVKQGRRIFVPASAVSRPSPDCAQGTP
jgi:Amidohydrolase family